MHLKSLTLRGFKSFAKSTTMRFEPGINCVVGPNGSGKSNVVDALAWVMGEQGAKNLRGGSMADVIFAGTSKRPALGRAEVSLTIDNTDGVLPIDYSEVTISRTLFRSGGSEYAINGTSCRLLDIQELLSDTGMGREMHVIIGQGRLDQVLTATPEDRRGFVEEAAGVLKHRRRKERTLRKLESMTASFTRVEDLTAELRRQLGPLAKQAEAARRAQIVQAEERDAKARLLADDIAQQQARMQAEEVNDEEILERRKELDKALHEVRDELAVLDKAESDAHPERARLSQMWERLSTLEERYRSLHQLARERVRSLASVTTNVGRGERPEDLLERAKAARAEEEALQEDVTRASDELTAAIADREEKEAVERRLEREVAELSRALADHKEDAARVAARLAAAKSRLEALEQESARVETAWHGATTRAEESAEQCARLEEEIVAGSDGDDGLSDTHEANSAALEQAKEALAQARRDEQAAREALASWTATADALELSLEPADATAWAVGAHVGELVRDKLSVAAGWEAALEVALGGGAEGIVVDGIEAAVDALRAVREADAGRLDVVVAQETDAHPAQGDAALNRARAALSTIEADAAILALDAITATDDISAPIRAILADTILARDLVTARHLLAGGARRVVTATGDVLEAHRAAGGQKTAASTLARHSAYIDAKEHVDNAADTLEAAAQARVTADSTLTAAQAAFDTSGAQLAARDAEMAAAVARLGALRQALAAAREEVERTAERREGLADDIGRQRATADELAVQLDAASADPTALAEKLAASTAARDSAHEATRQARGVETEARLALRTREERLRAILGRADSLERSAQALAERIEREERAALRRSEAGARAGLIGDQAQRALDAVREIRERVGRAREAAEELNASRALALREARSRLDELSERSRRLDDAQHRQELARAELRLRFEQLAAKSLEELGTEAGTLVDEYGPHVLVPTEDGEVAYVREEQEKRLARARRDLQRLGKINPLALEEHAALEERQKYLAGQLADLKKSREDLLRLVRDLDTQLDSVLRSALADVAEAFEHTFATLFPGGEGRLVLTDPDSPLTTGIDIEARPPGKKVKRLSLLSGGERSLTAIAFLVAIFMSRPSPFYVMDEVEAALDDVNLSRLLDIFKELQKSSQLLVVTHQKRTMEIADCLYGVTMQEEGVTTVVSQRMSELAKLVER
ncbi:chromosome segregation protein SMC [Arcanobacterium haemolyticum]|nr:chromosome segregation protein SMC [Arcanobacterium haemolyticum]